MIVKGVNPSDIKEQAIKEGMITMVNDGMQKVEQGFTTPTEILRTAYNELEM